VSFASDSTTAPDPTLGGAQSCARSGLPPWLRLAIFFVVVFGLKYALAYTALSAAVQVLALVAVATVLVYRFWWACNGRRGALMVISTLWIAAAVKIALL
jgi:hypothetical protein